MKKFNLGEYLISLENTADKVQVNSFEMLCDHIRNDFLQDWETGKEELNSILTIQKKAIIGYAQEVSYFKSKIKEHLTRYNVREIDVPNYYEGIEDAIYHENWGLAGVAEWFSDRYSMSSSAKIIGDRIYFLEQGRMVLKQQKICQDRREQLIRAFLLYTPDERMDKSYHEIYMLDGTRVTIFGKRMTKMGQDAIIFRRYVIPSYTFEEQAMRGSIPANSIPLFKAMVATGYNVAFVGAVRSAKTTFLSTWQSYEDQALEGVMVETDPEIPLHMMMPEAPIVQIIADNENLKSVSKNLVRSDADYFIMAEARDGIALDTVLRIASKGTRRMKITFHIRDPLQFCYDVADEITKSLGGDIKTTALRVASSFDYIFHFIQLRDKSKKRLKGVYELGLDDMRENIRIRQICKYHHKKDNWTWTNEISEEKRILGEEENSDAFNHFSGELQKLAGGEGG